MKEKKPTADMAPLEPLVGEWSIEAVFEGAPPSDLRGRTMFERTPGGAFLLQRWEVPIDEAPDGLGDRPRRPDRRGRLHRAGQHLADLPAPPRAEDLLRLEGRGWARNRDLVPPDDPDPPR